MTVYGRMLVAASGSFLLLFGAFAFQYLGGLAPCEMCIWQRWPHAFAILVGLLGITVLWRQRRAMAVLGTAAMTASAGLGLFHAGVEQGWWAGLTACATGDVGGMSTDDLMAQIMDAPVVRCDEIAWSFLGLSMAAWNGLISAGLAGCWGASVVWWRMPFSREA
ncbi:MAG: disulfide bond formation protein B [Pseudomonadota bacterium]